MMTQLKMSDFEDPNDYFLDMYAVWLTQQAGAGIDPDETAEKASEFLDSTIESLRTDYVASLEEQGQQYVNDAAVFRMELAERLRVYWGPSLDLHEKITAAVEEGGVIFARRNEGISEGLDKLLGVLIHLNGQAVRVSREVHALLSSGFPLGSHVLSRTMHEIAVRAGVLEKFGRKEPHLDLAERFLWHDKVVNYNDALAYQENAERLRGQPFSNSVISELKKEYDEAIGRFGKSFKSPYGWAAGLHGLPSPGNPNFKDLEKLAELDHFRSIYRWSSHYVHADAKAMRISLVERGGGYAVLTSSTNNHLADPGQNTLIGLIRVFTSMVVSVDQPAFYDLLLCECL